MKNDSAGESNPVALGEGVVAVPERPGRAPPIVPDHELLRRIGHGSYGDVWLARTVLGELRAVKIVHRAAFDDDRPFQREFEGLQKFAPISRSHPSQLAILHVGRNEAEGCFYYVMELADAVEIAGEKVGKGERENDAPASPAAASVPPAPSPPFSPANYSPHTLKHALKHRAPLPPTECVRIGLALAEALTHLHQHGLVHRDIKPSNIIFVGGVPKLADIGLVTDVDASRSFVGTEGYLPPEGPGTPQADIYGLGKVLYELCTGKDRKDYPALPPDLRERPESEQRELLELNAVLVKACATDPRERYQTAEELHTDLALLQRGSSVRQKRATQHRFNLAKKFCVATAALALLLAMVWLAVDRPRLQPSRDSKGHLPKSWQPSPEAKKLHDEGWRHLMKQTRDGIAQSIDCFSRAVELEPNYALAYCALADAHASQCETVVAPVQALADMRKDARRAVEIDDNLPDGHAYLGLSLFYSYDFAGAETEFKRAIALGPTNSRALMWYAQFLRSVGRLEEARTHQLTRLQLRPNDPSALRDWIRQLLSEGKFEEALREAEKLDWIAPDWVITPYLVGTIHARMGRFEEAVSEFEKVRAKDELFLIAGLLGHAYGRAGRTNEARALLQEMEDMSHHRYVTPMCKAAIYAGLGETNEAIRLLYLGYEDRCRALVYLKNDPEWSVLRPDPRFVELLRKVGLEN